MKEIKAENKTNEWLTSKEAMKALKISACDLKHKRESGLLKFTKKGNAYYYRIETA